MKPESLDDLFGLLSIAPSEVAFVVLDANGNAVSAFREEEPFYPASVIKLPYLVFAASQLAAGAVPISQELERAVRDMIVDSSNDATALVLDVLTGTTGGPELRPRALRTWMQKRQRVNTWLRTQGFLRTNACQKTWNEAPYGRERQGYGPNFELRNQMCALEAAEMLHRVCTGGLVPSHSVWMKGFLERRNPSEGASDPQAEEYIGSVLTKGWKLYSKAGCTDEVRHDVAHVVNDGGRQLTMAVFTKSHSKDKAIIPELARWLLASPEIAWLGSA